MSQHAFSNRLIHERSPYLLQHAHNPVDWYPWGEEALSLAKKSDKPILVSIGYAACHWCHVMERESFEDPHVARFMNEHFINIKVDREERPDIDNIYMESVQIMTGTGGWPLNVFLTPDTRPFFGGTYFPPKSIHQRPSWLEVLTFIKDVWQNKRQEVDSQAVRLIEHMQSLSQQYNMKGKEGEKYFDDTYFKKIRDAVLSKADFVNGGFGMPPKFPHFAHIRFLFAYDYFFNDKEGLDQALFSLKSMLCGGIYDQLGGGLARYSTDATWLVPHFEKMLYDNALFIEALAEAYKITKDEVFATAIREVVAFLKREMMHPEGGFYAAIDADSEGVEGKFYVWSKKEVELVLGNEAAAFCSLFNISEEGNWEGENILHLSEVSKLSDISDVIIENKRRLLEKRSGRIRPSTDDKILLGWNAMLVTALCKASSALNDDSYRELAISTFEKISAGFMVDNIATGRVYKNGHSYYTPVLDDLAYLIQSCISLLEITGDDKYLLLAQEQATHLFTHFSNEQGAYFYFTDKQEQGLAIRKTEMLDGATPNANSLTAYNLQLLSALVDNSEWRDRAKMMLDGTALLAEKYPDSLISWSLYQLLAFKGYKEIVITGAAASTLCRSVLSNFLPNALVQSSTVEKNYPLLKNKKFGDGGFIYVCENFTCREPVKTIAEFLTNWGN